MPRKKKEAKTEPVLEKEFLEFEESVKTETEEKTEKPKVSKPKKNKEVIQEKDSESKNQIERDSKTPNVLVVANFKDKYSRHNYKTGEEIKVKTNSRLEELIKAGVVKKI